MSHPLCGILMGQLVLLYFQSIRSVQRTKYKVTTPLLLDKLLLG